MYKIKFLTVLLLVLFSANIFAQDVNVRHWLRDMPDDMRLSQLSIPAAHESSSWASSSFLFCDQLYNESELFERGVRSFDIRLGVVSRLHYGMNTYHQSLSIKHSFHTISFDIKDEIEAWPTKEQLDGTKIEDSEFLILNIGLEYESYDDRGKNINKYNDSYDAYQRRMAMDSILYILKDRYGNEDKAGNPRFVSFRPEMKVSEMRGKIFVFFGNQTAGPADLADYKYKNWVTVNTGDNSYNKRLADHPTNEDGHIERTVIRSYSENSRSERDAAECPLVAEYCLSQEYCEDNRLSRTMADYFRWAEEYFHSKIDMLNRQNIIFNGHLNGYAIPFFSFDTEGGAGTASDSGNSNGANHRAYDYIRTVKKPLGIVAFDFCGVDKDPDSGLTFYGQKLTTEIIRHNYIQKELMEKKVKDPYISDVMLVHVQKSSDEKKDEDKAKEILNTKGYEMVGNSGEADLIRNNGYDGNDASRIFMGVKYTDNPDSALTNIILVEHGEKVNDYYNKFHESRKDNNYNPKPDDGIVFWGSKYFQPVKTYNDHPTWKDWNGDLAIHMGTDWCWIHLWQERHPRYDKDDAGGALTEIKILRGDDIPKYSSNLVPYMTLEDSKEWSHGANSSEVGNNNVTITIPRATYLQFEKHVHNSNGSSYDDKEHFSLCTDCGYKFNGDKHTFSRHNYDPDLLGISHSLMCDDGCGYSNSIAEQCAGTYDSNGFGKCEKCGQVLFDHATRTDGTYEVSNAGQLYWIVRNVPIDDPELKVILTSDIRIPDGIRWTPIGDDVKPFKGTFDGKGHTISGINADGYSLQGLFGDIYKATVKNLGVVDSKISGSFLVGSIAGRATHSIIENVFSTAEIASSGDAVGAFVGCMDNSMLSNSFFDGKFSLGKDELVGYLSHGSVMKNLYIKKDKYNTLFYYGFTEIESYDFFNGKLCYWLNECKTGKDAVWCQDLTKSLYPTPSADESKMVYAGFLHGSDEPGMFCNDIEYLHRYHLHLTPHNPNSSIENENHDLNYSVESYWKRVNDIEDTRVWLAFKCNICDNQERFDTVAVLDEDATVAATCVEGHNIYTASWEFNKNAIYNVQCEKVTPAVLDHDYADDGFSCRRCLSELYQPAELIGENPNTYKISNAGQLYWFSKECHDLKESSNAILANDIVVNEDMTKDPETLRQWDPICASGSYYCGTFDGQGHTISGLYRNIGYLEYTGLFGDISGGTVKNLGLINSVFHGSGVGTGSIAGSASEAKLYNIYSDAELSTTAPSNKTIYVGGFVGHMYNCEIKSSYFDGLVEVPEGDFDVFKAYNIEAQNYYVKSQNAKFCQGATVLDDAVFNSPQLTILLNNGEYGKDAVWRQNIDASDVYGGYKVDAMPVLTPNHDMVVPAKYNGKDFINLHVQEDGDGIRYYRDVFEVTDQEDFYCPVDFAVMNANQSRDMANYTWGTVCLPFNIDNAENGGVKLYRPVEIITSGVEPVLILEEIDKLEAGTPAVFKKLDKEKNSIVFICEEGCIVNAPKEENSQFTYSPKLGLSLIGTFTLQEVKQDNTSPVYYYSPSQDNFTKVVGHIWVDPFRAWVQTYMLAATSHTTFTMQVNTGSTENPTDIEVVEAENMDIPMYDISGRRVVTPFKGKIVIRKGKKTLYNSK